MRKLLAVVACATALMLSAAAQAATVDLFVTRQAGTDLWDLTVNVNGAFEVGAISLVTEGVSAFTAGPRVSVLDSVLNPGADGFVIINAPVGALLASPFEQGAFIGSFTAASLGLTSIREDVDLLGPAVINPSGEAPPAAPGDDNGISITVPEPSTLVLLGLGLAGLALVRRTA